MGLILLILGLILFAGGHLLSAARGLRARLIAAWGRLAYRGCFALVAAIGIALMAYGFCLYRGDGMIAVWSPPAGLRHLAALVVLIALVLIMAAYARGHLHRVVKHPMLAGVMLWALAHLLVNGDLGSIILFGGLLVWALIDRISLKFRSDPGAPPLPQGGWGRDAIAVVAGIVLYLALGFVFHPLVIGVPVF